MEWFVCHFLGTLFFLTSYFGKTFLFCIFTLIGIWVSQGHCNKSLQTEWLQTTEVYSLTVWEPEIKDGSFCQLWGRICSMPLSWRLVLLAILSAPCLVEVPLQSLLSPSDGLVTKISVTGFSAHRSPVWPHFNLTNYMHRDPVSK